jgi:hypothetical protein
MRSNFLFKGLKDTYILKFFFLILIMQVSVLSFCQRRNGYLGLDAGVYVIKHYDPAVGAHFSGNAELANDMFLGAEIGVVKFDGIRKAYFPLLARFSMMPALNSGRARLLILLAPGYGIYDDSYRRGGIYYKEKGGFDFYGGIGAAFKGKQNGYLTLTVGYSTFGFTTNGYKSNIDGVGIRFGGMFR